MFHRRLYGVLDATKHMIVAVGIIDNYSMLGSAWIAVLEAKIYHFDCIRFAVRDLKSER